MLAYPTETVYGLGCDPTNEAAVMRILQLKQRPVSKGLILIAAAFEQLAPYLRPLTPEIRERVFATWPGPVTWVLPSADTTPTWLRGEHEGLAVRLSTHPVATAICREAGTALVSTSANRSGQPPAVSAEEVRTQWSTGLDFIFPGKIENPCPPSEIREAISGKILRPGG